MSDMVAGRRVRAAFFAALLVALAAGPSRTAQAAAIATCESTSGFLPVGGDASVYTQASGHRRPEAKLRYTLACPTTALAPGAPTLFIYSGYGDDPTNQLGGFPRKQSTQAAALDHYRAKGYAVLGVSPRGAGCSTGEFDIGQRAEAEDGYDVVEWVADQPWSNGKVAMIGESYGAIMQFPVAALRPPSLVAVAAQHPVLDLYRDLAYPGGIHNTAAVNALGAGASALAAVTHANQVATQATLYAGGKHPGPCVATHGHTAALPSRWRQHPWLDEFWIERSTTPRELEEIAVPVWGFVSWHDETLGGRGAHLFSSVEKLHAVASNGGHRQGVTPRALELREAFLDHYVLGTAAEYGEPRVRVLWEVVKGTPRWESEHTEWPPSEPVTLNLDRGGRLAPELPSLGASSTYRPLPSSGQARHRAGWAHRPPEPTVAVFTTAPLTATLPLAGPASLDLSLSVADAVVDGVADTDIQVTLSEVRPDGKEMYVQEGWLRASHRALERSHAPRLTPVHSHAAEDAEPLVEGVPTAIRVELRPFAHVFRAGSQVRIAIGAPKLVPGPSVPFIYEDDRWGFEPAATVTTNTIHHGGTHVSRLVLPAVAGSAGQVEVGLPACQTRPFDNDGVSYQFCR